MSTKHIFTADGLVERSLAGVAAMHPGLRFYQPAKVVYDATWAATASTSASSGAAALPIALVAGGGAGHEPAFAGYVGKGMLAAAVSGDIFASPSTRQIGTALDLLRLASASPPAHNRQKMQVLFVVLNYSGDALNFGVAQQKARQAGWEAEVVLVGDDVSVGRAQGARVGRRGLAAQVFVIKALGAVLAAAAAPSSAGGDDDEAAHKLCREVAGDVRQLAEFGRAVARHAATMGASLDHCHVPGSSDAEDGNSSGGWSHLEPRQVGLGVGIHNEPGVRLLEPAPGPTELVRTLLRFVLDPRDSERAYFAHARGERLALVVNNLGGLSTLELGAVVGEAVGLLGGAWEEGEGGVGRGEAPERVYAGTFLSSLNAPGFSLSLLNLDRIRAETGLELVPLLDAPTDTVGWSGARLGSTGRSESSQRREKDAPSAEALYARRAELGPAALSSSSPTQPSAGPAPADWDPHRARRMLAAAADALLKAEPEITRLDTVQGDGDCGTTLRALARAVHAVLEDGSGDDDGGQTWLDSPLGVVQRVGAVVEASMGGTSGALYALFFSALGASLSHAAAEMETESGTGTARRWADATSQALDSLFGFTLARRGDRTLIDALEPFVRSLSASSSLEVAVRAAREGAESTSGMVARLGRAAYVGEQMEGESGEEKEKEKEKEKGGERLPDPGAIGVAALLEGLLQGFKNK